MQYHLTKNALKSVGIFLIINFKARNDSIQFALPWLAREINNSCDHNTRQFCGMAIAGALDTFLTFSTAQMIFGELTLAQVK